MSNSQWHHYRDLYDALGEKLESIVGGHYSSIERLAMLQGERDSLRSEVERLRSEPVACPRCHRPDLTIESIRVHLASCFSRTDEEYLREEVDSLRARLAAIEPVWEAAKTWCETVYVGRPHPRYPAYPGDELLIAVNGAKRALAAEKEPSKP
jgi:hypothetical protein